MNPFPGRIGQVWPAIALLALAVVVGVNLVATARRVPPPSRLPAPVPADNVRRAERRLAPLRAALDARGVPGRLGYIGDLPAATMGGDTAAMEQYFLAQFALLPRVLETDPARGTWAVLNVLRVPPAERLPEGFTVVEECGPGVMLLRRVAP